MEINGWSSKITFSATHVIPGHTKCGRLHGHDYAINMVIHGDIGPKGVIMDFVSVKEFLRGIASELDHRVIIPGRDPRVAVEKDRVRYDVGSGELVFPRSDCIVLDIEVASAEMLANFVLDRVTKKVDFPGNVKRIEIGIDEGRGQGAWAERVL